MLTIRSETQKTKYKSGCLGLEVTGWDGGNVSTLDCSDSVSNSKTKPNYTLKMYQLNGM